MNAEAHVAARVRALLATHGYVEEKRVLGRLAFLVDGAMCCSVGPDGILVAVTPTTRDKLLTRAHVTPMTLGARTMRGFVRVAPPGFRTEAALRAWLERGVAAARAKRR